MAKIHPMVSMELDDEAKLDMAMPIPMPERPDYPYGLRICLTDKEMAKLGLDPADAVKGSMIHLHAIARVTDVTISDGAMGKSARAELQITDMCCVESEDAENDMAEQAMNGGKHPLYDKD